MDFSSFFQKEQIIMLEATEKQPAIRELVGHLEDLGYIENQDRYYAHIVHRESLENTGIGQGFAIPHARSDTITELVSILGIVNNDEGIDYQSYDGNPVKYILLSIFPTSMSTKYLYLIGMVSRIIANDEKRQALEKENTRTKIFNYLKKESALYFKSISEKDNEEFAQPENLTGVPSSDLDLLIRLDRLYHIYDQKVPSSSIENKIDSLRKLIDNRSLTYYERMRKKKSNPFAILDKSSCSGCHMEIPPVDINKIRERKGISLCTHCGRFLIQV